MAENKTSFGLTTETRSSATVPFKVTEQNHFNLARLDSVFTEDTEIKQGANKGSKILTLNFKFVAIDGTSQHTEKFFPVNETSTNPESQTDYFNSKMKHMIEAYIPWPTSGVGVGTTDWAGYFKAIESFFNTGLNGTPIFKTADGKPIDMWLYLTYKDNGLLQLPLPNFIEKAIKIGDKYSISNIKSLRVGRNDKLTMPRNTNKSGGGAPVNTATTPDDLPPGFQ